jgi:hypothetical protein
MAHSPALKRSGSTVLVSLLDPFRYVREADQALADGDRDRAQTLIARAYFAFDLCAAGCEHARARDRESSERNS